MVNGSELASRVQREKWAIKTKYRVMPMDFTKMRDGKSIVEVEEVGIATNTMSFEDYVEVRKAFLVLGMLNLRSNRGLLKFLAERGIRSYPILQSLLDSINGRADSGDEPVPATVKSMVDEFEQATRDELWDSPAEIQNFFQDDENFRSLVGGEYGRNLRFTYHMKGLWEALEDWLTAIFRHAEAKLLESDPSPADVALFREVTEFCMMRAHNLTGRDRMQDTPRTSLTHDVPSWLTDPDGEPIQEFAFDSPRAAEFVLSDEQYRLLEDMLGRFGDDEYGRAQIMRRINPNLLWRRCVIDSPMVRSAGEGLAVDSHADPFRSSQFN